MYKCTAGFVDPRPLRVRQHSDRSDMLRATDNPGDTPPHESDQVDDVRQRLILGLLHHVEQKPFMQRSDKEKGVLRVENDQCLLVQMGFS